MNEENQISYYAVIPATIRYDNRLKAAEKLLYGEVTSLANKFGYCFASNRYFSSLYNVTPHTVSQWFSHLEKLGYLHIELIKNSTNEITERRIYIIDTPYVQKSTYPYVLKSKYPIYKKVQYNNIKYNIDDLFSLVINNNTEISTDFLKLIKKLEFNYTKKMLDIMQKDKIIMIKNIIYVLYNLYNNNFYSLLLKLDREFLINLYKIAEKNNPNNLLNYYEKSILNNTS